VILRAEPALEKFLISHIHILGIVEKLPVAAKMGPWEPLLAPPVTETVPPDAFVNERVGVEGEVIPPEVASITKRMWLGTSAFAKPPLVILSGRLQLPIESLPVESAYVFLTTARAPLGKTASSAETSRSAPAR